MTGTFIDTIIVCSMTGLTIMVTGSYETALANNLEGVDVTINAFFTGTSFGDMKQDRQCLWYALHSLLLRRYSDGTIIAKRAL